MCRRSGKSLLAAVSTQSAAIQVPRPPRAIATLSSSGKATTSKVESRSGPPAPLMRSPVSATQATRPIARPLFLQMFTLKGSPT